jgi:hypothetical protein
MGNYPRLPDWALAKRSGMFAAKAAPTGTVQDPAVGARIGSGNWESGSRG